MKKLFCYIGFLFSYIVTLNGYNVIKGIHKYCYTGFFKRFFASFGKNSVINPSLLMLVGARYIHVGNNVYIGSRVQLTAWDKIGKISYHPEILLGDNVSIGDESQVTAINRIIIGNGVLTGKKVLITDNAHGRFKETDIYKKPLERDMFSKGPVIIKDNVWIGEKSTILAGVTIGVGCIIGANSVVTKDVPDFCMVAGAPAKIIKRLNMNFKYYESSN